MMWLQHLQLSLWICLALSSTRCQTMPTTATTVSTTDNESTTTNTIMMTTTITYSTTPAYDAEGAMKFTVTVVLVFGVGVIGLLGIYHHRNINDDLSAKEADDFVKSLERKRSNMEKQYHKKLMLQLVDSIFSRTLMTQKERQRKDVKSFLRPTLSEPNLLQTTSLLSDYRHNENHAPPTQDHHSSQDEPAKDHLLEPNIDPRSRSKSFHVSDARNFNRKRVEALERAKLQMKKPFFKDELNGADTELCAVGQEQTLSTQTSCQKPASPSPPRWFHEYDKLDRSGGDQRQDTPLFGGHRQQKDSPGPRGRQQKESHRPGSIDVQLGGQLLVPIIKINDVLVT